MHQEVYSIGICAASASRTDVIEAQRAAEVEAKACAPIVTITQARIDELRATAKLLPDHDDRFETEILKGPLNSGEALYLGSFHAPARMLSLRKRGYEIASRWVRVRGFDDQLHRVHEWRLVSKPAEADRSAVVSS